MSYLVLINEKGGFYLADREWPFYTDEQKRRTWEWTGEAITRASIGLENADDLIRDLEQALRARTFKGLIGPLAYQVMKKI